MPQMLKAGYSRPFTVALTACSSTMGNIIPPSILMVVYGAFGNVSIGMLFLGGFLPGLLLGFGQMGLVYYLARRYDFGYDDAAVEKPRFWRALGTGALPMGVADRDHRGHRRRGVHADRVRRHRHLLRARPEHRRLPGDDPALTRGSCFAREGVSSPCRSS